MTADPADVHGRTFYLGDDPPIRSGPGAAHQRDARPPAPRTVPLPLLRWQRSPADLAERAGVRAPLTSFRLDNLLTPMLFDLAPLMRVAGALPYDEAAGVAATVTWMRDAGLLGWDH